MPRCVPVPDTSPAPEQCSRWLADNSSTAQVDSNSCRRSHTDTAVAALPGDDGRTLFSSS